MRAYLEWFLKDFEYPQEAAEAVLSLYERMESTGRLMELMALAAPYDETRYCDFPALYQKVDAFAAGSGEPACQIWLLFLIRLSRTLREYYKAAGINEKIWHTCMLDLLYKTVEGQLVHGCWGIWVAGWYPRFFQMTRFAFCKLQFETEGLWTDYRGGGIFLPAGSLAVKIHIPRTGTHLDRESMERSFAEAAEFYRPYFGHNPTVFECRSWLLFPRHREMLKPGSNLLNFMDFFDYAGRGDYDSYNEVWRLFDKEYTGDVDALPGDTTLRRAYKELIRNGEKTGWGCGIRVYSEGR